MNVFEIIKTHLAATGKDGIYNAAGQCACDKNDLSPGDCLTGECAPGKWFTCPGCGELFMTTIEAGLTLCWDCCGEV